MSFSFDRFSADSLAETQNSWISTADNLGIPQIDYLTILSWANEHINYEAEGDSLAYGVFEDGAPDAVAIVDIVYSPRPGKEVGRLKMLRVSLSPTFEPAEIEKNTGLLQKVIDIYAEATIGTVKLSQDHLSRVIKIYGRNDNLLSLLVGLNERLKSTSISNKVTTKMEGRWLVITAH